MRINFKSTKQRRLNIRILCYGTYGAGKTQMCATAPDPVILSVEGNLICLEDKSIPFHDIRSAEEALEAAEYLSGENNFRTICLDSISELAEIQLTKEFDETTNTLKAYGKMGEMMNKTVRAYRNIKNKHLYFTAKQKRVVDEGTKRVTYCPFLPGQIFADNVPHMFDVVACLRIGKKGDEDVRYLQVIPDGQYQAKDSSGRLSRIERPNLTEIFNKITGE